MSDNNEFTAWYMSLDDLHKAMITDYGQRMVKLGKTMAAQRPAQQKPSMLATLGREVAKRLQQPSTFAGGGILAILLSRYLPGVEMAQVAEAAALVGSVLAMVLNEARRG